MVFLRHLCQHILEKVQSYPLKIYGRPVEKKESWFLFWKGSSNVWRVQSSMPNMDLDFWSGSIHDGRSSIQSMDAVRLFPNCWVYSGLLGQFWIRWVFHAKLIFCLHQADKIYFSKRRIYCERLLKNLLKSLLTSSSCLLHDIFVWMADRSLPCLRSLVVHILNGFLWLPALLVECVHYDHQWVPRVCRCQRRLFLLGMVHGVRNAIICHYTCVSLPVWIQAPKINSSSLSWCIYGRRNGYKLYHPLQQQYVGWIICSLRHTYIWAVANKSIYKITLYKYRILSSPDIHKLEFKKAKNGSKKVQSN